MIEPANRGRGRRLATTALALAVLAGCASSNDRKAEVVIRGTDPATGAPTATSASAPPRSSTGGVNSYDGYQTAVAQQGDTVASVAARVGISATELGAYNGLTANHQLRAGDELVLPPRPDGYGTDTQVASLPTATPGVSTSSIEASPLDDSTGLTTPSGVTAADDGFAPIPADQALAGSAASGAPASGEWSPDLAAAAIERSVGLQSDGSLGAPPSAADPVPANPSESRDLQSPDLGQYQTDASTSPPPALPPTQQVEQPLEPTEDLASIEPTAPDPSASSPVKLRRPVPGPVAVGFNKGSGSQRNDGVDFATPAGTPVVAAADGEVALVSESLGGLGTILLLRHSGDLLTVYGRIDGVTVRKGEYVKAGQQVGVVSDSGSRNEDRMHFEVRRGAESLDPMDFL